MGADSGTQMGQLEHSDQETPGRTRPTRRRRLSAIRVLVALAIAAGSIVGSKAAVEKVMAAAAPVSPGWFAPYVDVTVTPRFPFEDRLSNPADDVVLSFVVGGGDTGCTPMWGADHTLDEAATALDLERRLVRYRESGGSVIVSFGGAANQELALTCRNEAVLFGAYRSVVNRYDLDTIDFDVEAGALADAESVHRRAGAVKGLQDERRKEGHPLAVWVTLPVTPDGMPTEAVAVVDAMLGAGVDLAGVNVMTMNYATSRPPSTTMAAAARQALEASYRQLERAYGRAGVRPGRNALWHRLGATPMIGQNDVAGETFDLAAAEDLVAFATEHRLGRISSWSLNRDVACRANADTRRALDYCSGIDQEPFAFTRTFGALKGRAGLEAAKAGPLESAAVVTDDPATSPYPIWRDARGYPKGRKVVWHGNVYQAKWWTQGELPDAPVVHEWETPWQFVGPVLPGERRARVTPTTMSPGTHQEWSATKVYDKGVKVLHRGLPYEAKWWTEGDRPDAEVDNEWETPWKPLFASPDE
jgi:chitinase